MVVVGRKGRISGAGLFHCLSCCDTPIMDSRNLKTSHPPPSTYHDIVSSLVSPKSFLFHSQRPKPSSSRPSTSRRSPSSTASRTMDKAQQPSSFQQLEKVCLVLILIPIIWNNSLTIRFGYFSLEKEHMLPYVKSSGALMPVPVRPERG